MNILESIQLLPKLDKDINVIASQWVKDVFPDKIDPHPEYKLMANPTIEQACNWTSFKILCECFFVEGYKCGVKELSQDEEIEYYKKFCEEHKQDPDRNTNRFSFGAGLCYYKYNQLEK